jgi:hypothetical protein
MCRCPRVVLLPVLAAVTALLASGCSKKVSTADAGDAGDASTADGSSATLPEAGAGAAAAIAPLAPVPTATELAAQMPAPTPFSGTYRCFGGIKLEQSGRIVTSTLHKGTTDTVIACTVGRDTCTGTVREIVMVRGKAPKVTHVKPVTLTLTKSGDVVYVVDSTDKKAGQGAQTFCPRR